jgi:N-acetylglucosamine malate deacetylase 1
MKVIIISPHPDDETLGCGGSILKHVKNGDTVVWVIVTSVFTEHGFTIERVESRRNEIDKVNSMFGFSKVYSLGFPTTKLSEIGEKKIIDAIDIIFKNEKPEIVYLPNRTDAHSDHKMVFDAAMACSKSFRTPSLKRILMYECLSETEFAPALPENVFMPNFFIDVSVYFDKKLEIMRIYSSELGNHPFPRSEQNITALAVYRGSQAGVKYAEAFQLLKFIDK